MAMTTKRKAARRTPAKSDAAFSVEVAKALSKAETAEDVVLAVHSGFHDGVDVLTRDRKGLAQIFQGFCDQQSGEVGDKAVAYTQKMHWSLLDVIAFQKTQIEACMLAVVHLATALETERSAAKSIRRKSFDNLQAEQIDDRTVRLALVDGDDEAAFEFKFPMMIGRGVWDPTRDYDRGDVVTWGGTAWEAVAPDKGMKPEQSNGGWRIIAKRGRDGKDAR